MIKLQCFAEEWLFLREYTYIEGEKNNYHYGGFFIKKRYNHEPKDKSLITYLILDDDALNINITNKKGEWNHIKWEDIRNITVYYTIHPWNSAVLNAFTDEAEAMMIKTSKYFEAMRRSYKHFNELFKKEYDDRYSLFLETRHGNGHLPLPNSWIKNEQIEFLLNEMKQRTQKKLIINKDEIIEVLKIENIVDN